MTQAEFLHGLAERIIDEIWYGEEVKKVQRERTQLILTDILGPVLAESNKMADILAGDADCRWDSEYRAAWAAACEKLHGKADKPAS